MKKKSTLLLGTRKGLIVYKKENDKWKFHAEHFTASPVSYAMEDPRTGYWWVGIDHGHWGCKLQRSKDKGTTWDELKAPEYPEGSTLKDGKPASLNYIWMISPGHESQPETLYFGTVPGGLFVTHDGGETLTLNQGLWTHPSRPDNWFGGGKDEAGIHSILVNPNNPNHIILGVSCAAVFETLDGGITWDARNKGLKSDFLPDPNAEYGHDPHIISVSPSDFNTIWMQNHCGIFLTTDGAKNWTDVSEPDGPAKFGFVVSVDEEDPNTAWVIPAIADVSRVPIQRGLMVCKTNDGCKTWIRQQKGLPNNAYDIVYRHGMDITGSTLAFGTTSGNLFLSEDKGENWSCLNNYLAMVYSLRFAD